MFDDWLNDLYKRYPPRQEGGEKFTDITGNNKEEEAEKVELVKVRREFSKEINKCRATVYSAEGQIISKFPYNLRHKDDNGEIKFYKLWPKVGKKVFSNSYYISTEKECVFSVSPGFQGCIEYAKRYPETLSIEEEITVPRNDIEDDDEILGEDV